VVRHRRELPPEIPFGGGRCGNSGFENGGGGRSGDRSGGGGGGGIFSIGFFDISVYF
jgi:hypothetical protein